MMEDTGGASIGAAPTGGTLSGGVPSGGASTRVQPSMENLLGALAMLMKQLIIKLARGIAFVLTLENL